MNLRLRDRAEMLVAGAGMTKIFTVMTIVVVTGTVLFIVALGIALGVGFGVSGRTRNTNPVTLSPPTVTCSSSTATCGCPSTAPVFTSRIVNGQTAALNSWPWMVYLTNAITRTYCTGFIISPRNVLTAASCVSTWGFNVTVSVGINNFQSLFGGINVTNATTITTAGYGDIAVVTLGQNLTFNSTVQPCCLTTSLIGPSTGVHGVIAGWGETSTTNLGVVSPTLRQAVVQVVDPSVCSSSATNSTTICASFDSVSACPIDAGGPLMVSVGNAWVCVGVITGKSTCQNPIQFTRISSVLTMLYNATFPVTLSPLSN